MLTLRVLFGLSVVISSLRVSAQTSTSNAQQSDSIIFVTVEKNATPNGGMAAFYGVIGRNIQYPAPARKKSIEGTVYVEFVLEKDGSVSSVNTIKGIGYGCDEEAERVVALSPPWIPARLNGSPVRQKMVVPINFKLETPKALKKK